MCKIVIQHKKYGETLIADAKPNCIYFKHLLPKPTHKNVKHLHDTTGTDGILFCIKVVAFLIYR